MTPPPPSSSQILLPSPEERQPPLAGTPTVNMDQPIGLVIRSFLSVGDGFVYSRQRAPLRRNKKASDAFPILMQMSCTRRRPASFRVGKKHKREMNMKSEKLQQTRAGVKVALLFVGGPLQYLLQRRVVVAICSAKHDDAP